MKNIRYAILALAFAIAALTTSVVAQTKSGISTCFDGLGSAGLGGDVRTDFVFESVTFLLELESYDSGKTLTLYGKFQEKSAEKNELGVYDYSFIPFLSSCGKKDALTQALKVAFPGYKIKFANKKTLAESGTDAAKKGAKATKEKAGQLWDKFKKKP